MMNRRFARVIVCGMFFAVLFAVAGRLRAETILHHVHGLAFSADGAQIVIPSHVGLAVYRDGKWSKAPGPTHDYMGFSVTQGAIYSSGHPAPGSPLRNPFGLIKSTDGGRTWQQHGLAGEADFHAMAAGWRSSTVYVVNAEPNSRMSRHGLHYTKDDGKTWIRCEAKGITSDILSLAAHPTDSATVAVGTLRGGLMLSRDFGNSFRALGATQPVTAVVFERDGKRLLYAEYGNPDLLRRTLGRDTNERLKLPALGKDFVAFIAQNPANPSEIAIATRNRSVFVSKDAGGSWKQIAREGTSP